MNIIDTHTKDDLEENINEYTQRLKGLRLNIIYNKNRMKKAKRDENDDDLLKYTTKVELYEYEFNQLTEKVAKLRVALQFVNLYENIDDITRTLKTVKIKN